VSKLLEAVEAIAALANDVDRCWREGRSPMTASSEIRQHLATIRAEAERMGCDATKGLVRCHHPVGHKGAHGNGRESWGFVE
jgi:hypothetical protein